MKKTITEVQLRDIIIESVKKILKERAKCCIENNILIRNKKLGDNLEHTYKCKCFDGYAIGELKDKTNAPYMIKLVYPTLDEIINNEDMCDEVLQYNGLFDCDETDITFGDIMKCYGRIDSINNDTATMNNSVISEDNSKDYKSEILKNISWAKQEALEKLQIMLQEMEKLPDDLSAYKASNRAMIRTTIKDLQSIHSVPYKEEKSSLSMQQRLDLNKEW